MNTVQLLLAVASIATTILGPACSQQTLPLSLAPTVINQGDGVCTSDLVRESAREDIRISVQELLQIALPSLRIPVEECGEGLWRRVAFLNMSDSTEQCPSAWGEYNQDNVRACGRPVTNSGSCAATFYDVTSTQYSKVCGRIIGYQVSQPDAFFANPSATTVSDHYVDGVSLTYGNPRSHIWTATASASDAVGDGSACPCDDTFLNPSPSFVGNNYFCESGTESRVFGFLTDDPLWDGQGCPRGNCCSFNSPPWFSVVLPSPTTDNIEVRICADQDTNDEDTPIGLLELYIQ